jgi:hypothetical protein
VERQYRTLYRRVAGACGNILSCPVWQPQYNYPLYDYYYPTAGTPPNDADGPPLCNWQC